jgi:hypothetical protein
MVLKEKFDPIPSDAVMQLFEEAGSSRSLLNQVNLRFFFHSYENKDYASIKKRFGFTTDVQCQALYEQLKQYPDKLVTFKEQGGNIQAAMMQRMINVT